MTTTDISGLVPPDLAQIRSLSKDLGAWQGLYAVLWGVTALVPLLPGWLWIVALCLGTFAIRRYYKRTLGLVQLDAASQSKMTWIVLAILVPQIVAAAFFAFYLERPIPRLPPAFGPLLPAIGMVVWWQVTHREHSDILVGSGVMVACAAMLALGLPIPQRLTGVLFSCILIAHGVRTHFTLMRFVRSMQGRAGVGAV